MSQREHRAPLIEEHKNYRKWAKLHGSSSPGETATTNKDPGLGAQISQRFGLLAKALKSEDLPDKLRAMKQRQLDLERLVEIQTRKY